VLTAEPRHDSYVCLLCPDIHRPRADGAPDDRDQPGAGVYAVTLDKGPRDAAPHEAGVQLTRRGRTGVQRLGGDRGETDEDWSKTGKDWSKTDRHAVELATGR
jgi:hypothetical protein